MPTYEVYYSDGGNALVLKADLDRGWSRSSNRYGFRENTKIDFRGDCAIRTQLKITPAPVTVMGRVPDFPLGVRDWGTQLTLRDRLLEMKVALVIGAAVEDDDDGTVHTSTTHRVAAGKAA